ncbi:MAG: flagellar export chaperone FlgN, partial [Eubacterium sp.]|nr:flagellar export chaperone FlgN [Eubacterium sp.]
MASLMENLIDVLRNECSEYEELLELSQKKTPIIVKGNLENLQKITDEEQLVVSRLHNLEKKRTEVTADIANVLNKDVNNLKLSNLIEMLEGRPEEQKILAEVHDRLKLAVKGLKRSN